MNSVHDWSRLQERLGIRFRNESLLIQAFTHASYVNEHDNAEHDNERLEFLGDAVLELAVSEYLFEKYQQLPEGKLTKIRASIVCESSLVQFARMLEFGCYVLLGKGEERSGGRERPALLADVFEAFIGALYLDRGLDTVKQFLHRYVFPTLDDQQLLGRLADHKTELQELMQERGAGPLEYRIVEESGPAHDRIFAAEVYVGSVCLGSGTGRSKKEAEQQAAAQALAKLSQSDGETGLHGSLNNEQV